MLQVGTAVFTYEGLKLTNPSSRLPEIGVGTAVFTYEGLKQHKSIHDHAESKVGTAVFTYEEGFAIKKEA